MKGYCDWCFRYEEDVRMVQLTHAMQSGQWQEPKQVSKSCREHLPGLFRYVKKEKATK